MLTAYQTAVRNLIQAPEATTPLVPIPTINTNINTARNQVAAQGECIRNFAALDITTAIGTGPYGFSLIALGSDIPPLSVEGVLNVRKVLYEVGAGLVRVYSREWEWFSNYVLGTPVPVAGPPKYWTQFGQGGNGSIFVNLPDGPYTLFLDTVCLPVTLVDDTTPEAIPALWTDAVPYYAAWLSMQDLQRQADAEMMLKRFDLLMARARQTATPETLPHQFARGPDPMVANRLGVQPARGAPA